MKYILLLVILLNSFVSKSQCKNYELDTVRATFDLKMRTNVWDYYNPGGSPAYKNVKGYDSTLIPKYGFAKRRLTNKLNVEGYVIYMIVDERFCKKSIFRFVDLNWKDFDGFIMYYETKQ